MADQDQAEKKAANWDHLLTPEEMDEYGWRVPEMAGRMYSRAGVESLLNKRLRAQEDAVRATFASIGASRAAQRELMDLGVSQDDAGRILSELRREFINRLAAALRPSRPGDARPAGGLISGGAP